LWAEESPERREEGTMMNAPRTARPLSRTIAALVTAALLALPLAGCATKSAETPAPAPVKATAAFPVTITDDAARAVTIDAEPKRIVSLAPANTEIVYSLGIIDRLVGVTTWDDYPAQVKDIAKIGDFTTPNIEAIAGAEPDLILVTGGVQADVLSKLEAVGAKVVVIDPQNLEGVFTAIDTVARITGTAAEGDKVVAGMKADLADVAAKLSGVAPTRTFIEIGWNPLFTAGPGTLLDDLLAKAGGTNVVTEKGYVGYSVEQLVTDQPDVYLGTLSSIGDAAALAKRPGYGALSAIKGGRVFSLSDNLVSRPGPRVVEGVREIAAALHPDLFK
jgi:iron complex transport system substrate-binding protein